MILILTQCDEVEEIFSCSSHVSFPQGDSHPYWEKLTHSVGTEAKVPAKVRAGGAGKEDPGQGRPVGEAEAVQSARWQSQYF